MLGETCPEMTEPGTLYEPPNSQSLNCSSTFYFLFNLEMCRPGL